MGDENDLAPPFRCLEIRRQQLVDRLVVEVFVGLIDNQRAGIGDVHAEIQDQQDDALRAWRQLANAFADLGEREVLLGATSARIRGLGVGGRLELIDGTRLVVRAVVDDGLIGGGELALVDSPWASTAVPTDRYMLIQYDGARATFDLAAAAAVKNDGAVRVRAEGETPILRHADAVRPQAVIKEVFGEFIYQPHEGRNIHREAEWVVQNIIEADLALLGRFKCHRNLVPDLAGAMAELIVLN